MSDLVDKRGLSILRGRWSVYAEALSFRIEGPIDRITTDLSTITDDG